MIGSSVEPTHVFAPHRSATQMLVPSRSTSTALVLPHVRPAGSLAHPSTVRYGLGASFVGAIAADDCCTGCVCDCDCCCAPAQAVSVSARAR